MLASIALSLSVDTMRPEASDSCHNAFPHRDGPPQTISNNKPSHPSVALIGYLAAAVKKVINTVIQSNVEKLYSKLNHLGKPKDAN